MNITYFLTNNTEDCYDLVSNVSQNIGDFVILIGLFIFGVLITFFGNMFMKPTLFTGGAIISFTSSYSMGKTIMRHIYYNNCKILFLCSIMLGVLGGFSALRWYYFVNFILGAGAGASLGYFFYELIFYRFSLGVYFLFDTVLWICMLVPGILSGLYMLKKEREVNMLLTSLIGPGLILYSSNSLIYNNSISKYNIFYLIIYLLLVITGLYVQLRRTKVKAKDEPEEKKKFITYV